MRLFQPNRSLITLVLACMLIFIAGNLRPTSFASGLTTDKFWANKIMQKPVYDIVLAGDSRVFRGLSPVAMKQSLGGYRIFNFGFGGLGFGPAYMESAKSLLDPKSQNKIMVFGITPHSLTPRAADNNDYVAYKNKHITELYQYLLFGDFFQFFEPYSLSFIFQKIQGKTQGYYEVYYPNGWVASKKLPEDPMESIKPYEIRFTGNPVSKKIIGDLLDFVHTLSEENISVFAYRPPTTPEMRELEKNMSGFDEDEFVGKFKQAGGIWLTLPNKKYVSYDGSHLREDSAIEFSKDLAKEISEETQTNHHYSALPPLP